MVLVLPLLTPCLIHVHITCKAGTASCLKVAGLDQSLLSPLTQHIENTLPSTDKSPICYPLHLEPMWQMKICSQSQQCWTKAEKKKYFLFLDK